MSAFEIIVHPTHLMIPSDQFGYTPDGNNIKNIAGRFVEFEYQLGQRPIPKQKFMLFDRNLDYRIFPRHALDLLTNQLDKNGSNYKVSIETGAVPREVDIPINPDWKERDYQVPAIEFLLDKSESMRVLDLQTGKGKGLGLDAKIKIPGGWKLNGDMQVGDIVTAADGTSSYVTGVYPQGEKDFYRITFKDGRSVECDDTHLWRVHSHSFTDKRNRSYRPEDTWRIVTTLELHDRLTRVRNKYHIQLCKSEQIDDIPLDMDPYILGVFLGDGSISGGSIVLSTDQWIVNKIKSNLSNEMSINPLLHNASHDYHTEVRVVKSNGLKRNAYIDILRKMDLMGTRSWEKFIPEEYLHSSHSQRLALLQGLMDTDGCANKPTLGRNGKLGNAGSIEYCTTSEQLAKDVQYLIRSLGGICRIRKKIPVYTYMGGAKLGRKAYILNIRYPDPEVLFTLPRKKNLSKRGQYSDNLKLEIVDIEYIGKKESQCISIDHPDKLYVTDDFIVTHNTSVAIKAASDIGYCTIVIVSGLMDQWVKSFRQNTLLSEDDIYVIQGAKSLLSLFVQPEYKPKVFIASADTLQNYVIGKHDPNWPKWDLFCEHYGIGFKITDEIHLRFWANVMLDLHTAIRHNAYLSATPGRSSAAQDRIFSLVFPQKIQYGQGQMDKYIDTHFYTFDLDFGISERRVLTRRGYAHMRYEKFLLKNKAKFSEWVETILYSVIDEHFIKIKDDHEKCLVFVATIDFADSVVQQLRMLMPTMDIRTYLGRDPETNLERPGIIISTHKSAGTGNDIADLVTCINTVSYQTDIQTRQQTGRLRKLASGKTPHMVDMANIFFGSQRRHAESRILTYKSISKTYKESDIHG